MRLICAICCVVIVAVGCKAEPEAAPIVVQDGQGGGAGIKAPPQLPTGGPAEPTVQRDIEMPAREGWLKYPGKGNSVQVWNGAPGWSTADSREKVAAHFAEVGKSGGWKRYELGNDTMFLRTTANGRDRVRLVTVKERTQIFSGSVDELTFRGHLLNVFAVFLERKEPALAKGYMTAKMNKSLADGSLLKFMEPYKVFAGIRVQTDHSYRVPIRDAKGGKFEYTFDWVEEDGFPRIDKIGVVSAKF